jgi:hypothetical protein
MQFTAQNDTDRTPEPFREVRFGAGQTKQRQALALLGQQVDSIIAENMRRAAPL